ncbi:hypothetical protein B7494_g2768 [Chlorociboria aeruginascens]|nr:hypothetical protein B7494_g2768 [Chlorociboria aeruginascens]
MVMGHITGPHRCARIDQKEAPYIFVNDRDTVAALVDRLLGLHTSSPSLYIDLEGVNLSRFSTVSILQLYIHPHARAYLLDVHTLGPAMFSTTSPGEIILKMILEDATIPKVFFDVRSDSDALFGHFDIRLAGIHDLQLMELATRVGRHRFVNGLARCMDRDISMTEDKRQKWKDTKDTGIKLFAPERGGSYEVFNRPANERVTQRTVG